MKTRNVREDAFAIFRAGVAAVDSRRLVIENVHVDQREMLVGDESLNLSDFDRIVVVGAGKAGAGMAEGLELALGDQILAAKQLDGWINVPADCVRQLKRIKLHAARPAGVNEPTEEGVEGTRRILQLVESLTPRDLCFCLISGGGSALLPAPVEGISLADKQAITKHLSAAGANIQQLNTVRKQLSRIKGGGLARACRAGRLITLIISDVLGDPLDVIASGPTVPDTATAEDALRILEMFHAKQAGIPENVFQVLQRAAAKPRNARDLANSHATNIIIGNNATAVDAAGVEAERRGYSHAMVSARQLEGPAEEIGRHHADMGLRMLTESGPDCLITGGEPTVQLVEAGKRGKGGRNQQLVLAALIELLKKLAARSDAAGSSESTHSALKRIAILSGGTDGEDGPTDAAGAFFDWEVIEKAQRAGLDPVDYLQRNDAYHFFSACDGLIKTGPTHTNVCDLRIVVVER